MATKVMSLNPVHGEVYLKLHYVIWFVSDFSGYSEIIEILLKLTLNTITLTPNQIIYLPVTVIHE